MGNTHCRGNTFELDVTVPTDYPWSAPDLKFSSSIAHAMVSHDGKICLTSLFTHADWSPAFTLHTVLLAMITFLSEDSLGAPGCHSKELQPGPSARALSLGIPDIFCGNATHHLSRCCDNCPGEKGKAEMRF